MIVDVAAGAIIRDGLVFVTLRSDDKHQGGLWEFPGGKCELLESAYSALRRELAEEVGISVISQDFVFTVEHDYGDKKVRLHFFIIDDFEGEPHGAEGQKFKWVSIAQLSKLNFPKANDDFVIFLENRLSE